MSDALPARWCAARLAELGSVQLGKMLSAKAKTGRGARPYLRNVNVRWHRIDVADVLEMDFDAREVEKYQLLPGDVLVCEGGEPGRAAVWSNQLPGALYQKALHRVRFTGECVDPRYFTYFLELAAVEGLLAKRFTGSTIKHLPRESFLEMPIPVAPAAEQRRIVAALEEHLSELDVAVAGLERARANLYRFRVAELRGVFGDSTKTAARRSPDADLVYPELREVADIVSGNTPKGIDAHVNATGDHPWVKVGDMNLPGNERAITTARGWLSNSALTELRARLIPAGTIIFPKRGGAIATNKKRILARPCVVDLNTMGLIPRPGLGEYLWWWFQSVDLGTLGDGSNIPQINYGDVANLRVPLPPAATRDEIVRRLEAGMTLADRTGADIDTQLLCASRLRQSILKQAFEGKLVPQDPNDEPASVLLDRIRAERESRAPRPPKSRPMAKTSRKAPHR